MDFFATAAKGTEPMLRDELRELRLRGVRADRGGVHFTGDLEAGFRACLWSRVALRILMPLGRFPAPSGDDLYAGVRGLDFSPYLTPERTLSVSSSCKSSALTHTQFIAQRTKDAIVDVQRDASSARSSVDKKDADVQVFVHLVKDEATVYLDLAGESLHRRGYRDLGGEAPLKETLAAAIIRMSRWPGDAAFIDPMCGSGTFAIEAAMSMRKIAPGRLRARFGFERWRSHGDEEARVTTALRAEADAGVIPAAAPVFASDIDPAAVAATAANAGRAGVEVRVSRRELGRALPPRGRAWLVTNPPYGVRLHGGADFPEELARIVHSFEGCHVAILAHGPELVRAIRLRPVLSHDLWNGDLQCKLLGYLP